MSVQITITVQCIQDVYEFQLHVHNAQNKITVNLISQMLSFSLEYQACSFFVLLEYKV